MNDPCFGTIQPVASWYVKPFSISFVVPALNEEAVVESVVDQIMERVRASKIVSYEMILIDDGSTDRTGQIMDRLAVRDPTTRVIHNGRNLGFGSSYQRGLQEARFDYVMLLCGDGGLPASSLAPILEKIGTADIVVPWMVNLKQIKTPFRYALSRLYTILLNSIFGLRLHYYNGLPVHRRDLLQHISVTSGGFGFQAEILVKLIKSGCSFVEVGVHGAERTKRSSAMRISNWLSVARTIAHLLLELIRIVEGYSKIGLILIFFNAFSRFSLLCHFLTFSFGGIQTQRWE